MYYLWDYRMVPFWARSAFGLARNMRKTYIQGVPKLTGLIFICCFAPRAVVLSWMNQQVWRIPFKTRIQSAPCWSWPGRDPIGQNWPAHHRSLLQLSTPRLASRSRLAFRSRWRPTGGRCGHCVGVRVRRASRHITALSFRVPLTSPCTLRQTLGFSCCLTASFGLLLSLSGFILIPQGAPRRQRFTVEREMLEPCRVKCWDKLRVAWCRFRNAVAVTLVATGQMVGLRGFAWLVAEPLSQLLPLQPDEYLGTANVQMLADSLWAHSAMGHSDSLRIQIG